MNKMSIADAMKSNGSSSGDSYDDEQEAYVGDLQKALDDKDGQALYDAICAVVEAKGGSGSVVVKVG
jgi:cytochrome c